MTKVDEIILEVSDSFADDDPKLFYVVERMLSLADAAHEEVKEHWFKAGWDAACKNRSQSAISARRKLADARYEIILQAMFEIDSEFVTTQHYLDYMAEKVAPILKRMGHPELTPSATTIGRVIDYHHNKPKP